jgi:tetratricopeptide (TPR) repeat protein
VPRLVSVRTVGLAIAALAIAGTSQATTAISPQIMELSPLCGSPPPGGENEKSKRDFRARNSSEEWQTDFAHFERFHLSKAQRNIAEGNHQYVMPDLHFVLRRVPNHERALKLLIDFGRSGKRDGRYKPLECYFYWAQSFVPEDPVVWNSGGYFFFMQKNVPMARAWWQRALEVAPDDAEVHYNLGLVYFSEKDFVKAREHAWSAYSAGFALPGLRNKLVKAGQWREPPVKQDEDLDSLR